jgi:hypothetical protein
MWDLCWEKWHWGRFSPLPFRIPHSSSCIIRGWYNRPNSGRSTKWTQFRPHGKNNNNRPDLPISVAASFKGCTVFYSRNTVFMGSIPIMDMNVYMCSFSVFVLCYVGRGLAGGKSSDRIMLSDIYISKIQKHNTGDFRSHSSEVPHTRGRETLAQKPL